MKLHSPNALNDKIALLLKAANLSRSRLASVLAIDKSVVSRWLSGAVVPTEHNLTRLTDIARKTWPKFSLATWDLPQSEFARVLRLEPVEPGAPAADAADPAATRFPLPHAVAQSLGRDERDGDAYLGIYRCYSYFAANVPALALVAVRVVRRNGELTCEGVVEGRVLSGPLLLGQDINAAMLEDEGGFVVPVLMAAVREPKVEYIHGIAMMGLGLNRRDISAFIFTGQRAYDLDADEALAEQRWQALVEEAKSVAVAQIPMSELPAEFRDMIDNSVGVARRDGRTDSVLSLPAERNIAIGQAGRSRKAAFDAARAVIEARVAAAASPAQLAAVSHQLALHQGGTPRAQDAAAGGRPRPALDKPSIAVLAFDNMSGDAGQEYFSDGISEDIITDLSRLSELHVIARNSSFAYKQRAVSVPDVARELGVRYVLEGSVRKAGNRVRVTAQLIDSASAGHVWADRFDRDLTDIFAVQDELTREIVSALKVKLTADEESRRVRRRVVPIEAYHLFLRGREQAWLHTKAGNTEARNLLGRALAIDPDYAAAQAHVAFTHVTDYVNGWAPEGSLQTGLAIAQKAVEQDDEEPLAHFALAVACLWNRELDRALAEAGRCLALKPSSAEGRMVTAHIQLYAGEAAKAIETIDAYMRLDPLYPEILLQFLAEAHFTLEQFERAAAVLRQRLERNSGSETSHALLASCYGHLGRIEDSRREWADTLRIAPNFSIERRRRILPFKNPADFERRVEGLRKAGLVD